MTTKERISALLDKQRDIRSKADAESRAITAEEATEIRSILDEITTLKDHFDLEERANALDAEYTAPAPGQVIPKADPEQRAGVITDIHNRADDDPNGGFRSVGHFAVDVANLALNKPVSRTLQDWTKQEKRTAGDGMTVTVDSEGGVLMPSGFSNVLLEKGVEQNDIVPRCTTVPMDTASVDMPYIKDTDRSAGAVFGNIKMYWVDEEGTPTAGKVNTGAVKLNLHTLAGMIIATDKLLRYSPSSMESIFRVKMPQAISWMLTDAICTGAGAGRPQGITEAACAVSVAKETGQAADTIVYENLTKMLARISPELLNGMVWVANNDTLPQLMGMYIAVGTGGVPVWLPGNSAAGRPFQTLLGSPLILTEHMPTLGDAGDIMACCFGEYLLGMPSGGGGTQFSSSIHLKFEYAQTAFRFTMEVDGQPWWAAARTPRKSSQTVSPFVKLATR